MPSTLTFYGGDITDPSAGTPGLWDRRFSAISQNLDEVNATAGASFGSFEATANEVSIDTSGSANTATWSLPSDLRAPGSLLVTSDTSLNSTLTVGGNVALNSDLTVTGLSSFSHIRLNPQGFTSTTTKEIAWLDVDVAGGMGFFRSTNSATLRFSGGTFRTEGLLQAALGSGTAIDAGANILSQSHIVAGVNFSAGSRGFWIGGIGAGTGLVRDAQEIYNGGFRLVSNSVAADTTYMGVTSRGTFLCGEKAASLTTDATDSENSYGIQLTTETAFGGDLLLNHHRIFSVATVGSADSTSMEPEEIRFVIGGASGASLGIRSDGTIYFFESSASTLG